MTGTQLVHNLQYPDRKDMRHPGFTTFRVVRVGRGRCMSTHFPSQKEARLVAGSGAIS